MWWLKYRLFTSWNKNKLNIYINHSRPESESYDGNLTRSVQIINRIWYATYRTRRSFSSSRDECLFYDKFVTSLTTRAQYILSRHVRVVDERLFFIRDGLASFTHSREKVRNMGRRRRSLLWDLCCTTQRLYLAQHLLFYICCNDQSATRAERELTTLHVWLRAGAQREQPWRLLQPKFCLQQAISRSMSRCTAKRTYNDWRI